MSRSARPSLARGRSSEDRARPATVRVARRQCYGRGCGQSEPAAEGGGGGAGAASGGAGLGAGGADGGTAASGSSSGQGAGGKSAGDEGNDGRSVVSGSSAGGGAGKTSVGGGGSGGGSAGVAEKRARPEGPAHEAGRRGAQGGSAPAFELVFCYADGHAAHAVGLEVALRYSCRLAGLRRIGSHVPRHTFCSHLAGRRRQSGGAQPSCGVEAAEQPRGRAARGRDLAR